ncbi:MAG TPA: hypothetical protein VJK05_06020, partial [archaeon]|nr:hypothetical protein [archaeon]
EDNIGLSKLEIIKSGKNVEIETEVFNNNQQQAKGNLKVTITKTSDNSVQECSNDFTALTKEAIKCEFKNLSNAEYRVNAVLTPDFRECEFCKNNNVNDDRIESFFQIGAAGILEQCEPYNSTRLLDFIEATESNGRTVAYPSGASNKDKFSQLIKFKAHVIQDQYSKDFQEDFDKFAREKSFFNAPQTYLNTETGLGNYFKDTELFKFKRKNAETEPTGLRLTPGIYNVEVSIEFKNKQWKFFDESKKPNAVITVEFEKLAVPVPDSPFYYMPFNGLLGKEDNRINYGINYAGDPIAINNDPSNLVRTINVPGSSPVINLNSVDSENFKSLNVFNRGSVLSVTRGNNINLEFTPSYATPLFLKVKNTEGEAWAFYSVAVDNSTVQSNVGPENLLWSGIGLGCKDFLDRDVTEFYDDSADKHALDNTLVQCARVTPNKDIAYGLEWCDNLKKSGSAYFKTVVFTPQGQQSSIRIESASDSAALIGALGAESQNLALNGIQGILFNNYGQSDIKSVQDVFDLVKNRNVCVTGTGLKSDFVWNPKAVLDLMNTQEEAAIKQCIK